VYGEIEFECSHWGVFENAIDMAHIHYLHGDSFGNADKPAVMDMTTTRDTFETACNFRWVLLLLARLCGDVSVHSYS
jgi:phenylpropionate dioxygenase-like ring-hydroxylating dioxygenase large terminal subunit